MLDLNKTVFVFPGQGSQSIGMVNKIYEKYPDIKKKFDTASELLNIDLWDLAQNGPIDKLNQTEITQPILLTASIGLWEIWKTKNDMNPAYLAGHSLGEYSALVAAGVLDFNSAVLAVHNRGKFMQEAVPMGQGAVAAIIGLEKEKLEAICKSVQDDQIVNSVNFNSPGQIVIAGHKEAVQRAIDLAKEQGAKRALLLPVSVPVHCDLMRPASEKMENYLQSITFNAPKIPVINNTDVKNYDSPDKIKSSLVKQIYSPVRWQEIMEFFIDNNMENIIECGPGKVLCGLAKRINKNFKCIDLQNPENIG